MTTVISARTQSVHGESRVCRPGIVWSTVLALIVWGPACGLSADLVTAQKVSRSEVSSVIHVNRTIPQVAPPATRLSFSSSPTDAEFLRASLFPEPLAPAGKTAEQENRDLAEALLAYRDAIGRSGAPDAVKPILAFLAVHPHSAWRPVLQLDLGLVYRQTGHFSKAMEVWQQGWDESKGLQDPRGTALANAIVAHLSQLDAYLGRKELLHPLLDSIHERAIGGTAAQLVVDSHTGLYEMEHEPEVSFRCGPLALKRILNYTSAPEPSPSVRASVRVLDAAHSTPNGLSLSAVKEIAAKAGMNYQMAFRTPGAKVIIMPAVAHWKVGHYAAVVDRKQGRYLVQDTTFGEDIRMSPETLDEEASGYFLVPEGPLPEGWRSVSQGEGAKVWGRGNTGSNHDPGQTGCNCGGGQPSPNSDSPGVSGMTSPSVENEVVGLELRDAPVGYSPPLGPPVFFNMVYSHRDTQQPTTFSYTNFGPKWTFDWLSYITDNVGSSASALLYRRGGGNEPYTFSSTSATTAYAGPYSQAILARTVNSSGATTGFTLTYSDGSFEQFNQALGNQFFMTAAGDKEGNKATLTYDSQMRLVAITDAVGQVSTLTYALSGSPLLVTKITDPFGRSASFTYNSSGLLSSITDVLGITSSYTYGQGSDPDFVNTLTTPYGSTTFTYGDSSTNSSLGSTRFLKTVDPLGRASYVEYDQGIDAGDSSGGVMKDASQIPTGMNTCNEFLHYRNTFIFDANQYSLAHGTTLNYSLAKVIHWLHTSDETSASRVPESEKEPLENRVWYNYAGQPTGGSCDSIFFGVSSTGTVVNGASGRPAVIGRVLDNGTTQTQLFQYDSNGNITWTKDPVGRQTTYTYAANGVDLLSVANTTNGTQTLESATYNSQHLPVTITIENGATAHFQYNAAGQLTRYTDPLGKATVRTYDSNGRLKTIQGPIAGAQYTISYDNVGRIASETDPGGSTVRYSYDAADRAISATFPDGTVAQRTYNLLDLATATDRLGQTTHYIHDAARELVQIIDPLGNSVTKGYNLAGELDSITDPNGRVTTLGLDAQSRVIFKQYADGRTAYKNYQATTSLLATTTDALGQTITYSYNADNTLAAKGYNANQPTAAVSFQYDPAYNRVIGMTDGVGTTTYSYYPVGSGRALGANQLQTVTSPIAGASGSDTVTYSYDALNRVVGMSVDGVNQTIGYDALNRVTANSNALDTFSYAYSDATSRVTGVSSAQGPAIAVSWYNPTGDELLQQITATTQSGTSLNQFAYAYNADDLITSLTTTSPASQATTYTYDKANRLTSASGPAQYTYGYDPASNILSLTTGAGQQSFAYSSTNAITAGTYDANGSPLSLGNGTYTWDGANRIVSFTGTSGQSSTFTYDGLGDLVRVVDSVNGAVTADHSYLWCGQVRCLAHDNTQAGSPVSTQYFSQGVISGGTSLYYVTDRFGSVTQMVSGSGGIVAQYAYDPYGNQTVVSGTFASDIGYAGYYHHAASGLNFAQFRAFDPTHGRWLNRDPSEEAGGLNLYEYGIDDPVNIVDPRGKFGVIGWVAIGVIAVVAGGLIYVYYVCNEACGKHCPNLPSSGDPTVDEFAHNQWVELCKLRCEKAFGETAKVGPW